LATYRVSPVEVKQQAAFVPDHRSEQSGQQNRPFHVDGVQRVDRRGVWLAERGETVETGVVDKDVELFSRPALAQLLAELAREGGEAVVVGDVEGEGNRGPAVLGSQTAESEQELVS